jgi:hypothetical protein
MPPHAGQHMELAPNVLPDRPRIPRPECLETPAAGCYLELLRGLLAEVPLQVGEVALGGAQFGFGVAEPALFFLDSFHDP